MQFDLKAIRFLGRKCVVVCQNENGPCPLIALANALILQNRISIHCDRSVVSLNDLLEEVVNCFVESSQKTKVDEHNKTYQQQQLDDLLDTFPKLAQGLDLNVRFTGVTDFEFTKELSIFDAFNIPVVHGWVVDKTDKVASQYVGSMSYNHILNRLVEFKSLEENIRQRADSSTLITEKSAAQDDHTTSSSNKKICSEDGEDYEHILEEASANITIANGSTEGPVEGALITKRPPDSATDISESEFTDETPPTPDEQALLREGAALESFLEDSASQLTYAGLLALHETMRERQLAVFFRNNHFCTLFKKDAQLYLLVTDQGYRHVSQVVWERLDEIDGDTEYVDENFCKPVIPSAEGSPELASLDGRPSSASGLVTDFESINLIPTSVTAVPTVVLAASPVRAEVVSGAEIDPDLLLAMQLQRDLARGDSPSDALNVAAGSHTVDDADLALALRLQQQEEDDERQRLLFEQREREKGRGRGRPSGAIAQQREQERLFEQQAMRQQGGRMDPGRQNYVVNGGYDSISRGYGDAHHSPVSAAVAASTRPTVGLSHEETLRRHQLAEQEKESQRMIAVIQQQDREFAILEQQQRLARQAHPQAPPAPAPAAAQSRRQRGRGGGGAESKEETCTSSSSSSCSVS